MIYVLYSFYSERFSNTEWQVLLQRLPEHVQERICRFRRWEDRHLSLLGKLLLLEGLMSLGFSPHILEDIQRDNFGRPWIPNCIDFNISHSGQYAVCVLSDQARVGIDIERIREVNLCHFSSTFDPDLFHKISRSQETEVQFYYYWTQKESIIKADGRGLSIPLPEVHLSAEKGVLEGRNWFLKELIIHSDYQCHLAHDKLDVTMQLREVQICC